MMLASPLMYPARLPTALGTVSSAFATSKKKKKKTHATQGTANGPFDTHKPRSSSYSCPGRRQSFLVGRNDGTGHNQFA